jgi:ABC-type sugar transport system ATPase subunit
VSALLRIVELKKNFGSVEVLRGVSFEVARGQVVSIVGDNGAGKSTLMKCITGVYHADEGEIWFNGQHRRIAHPGESRALGIEMIYQDLALAGQQDVASNIFLGREPLKHLPGLPIRFIDRSRMEREAVASSSASAPASARSAVGPTGSRAASARASRSPGRSRFSPSS